MELTTAPVIWLVSEMTVQFSTWNISYTWALFGAHQIIHSFMLTSAGPELELLRKYAVPAYSILDTTSSL